MEQTNALATREDVSAIAQIDPASAWLYAGGNRISIDNEHRDGFVVKGTEEKLSELVAQISTIASLHSHRQPDDKQAAKGAPKHLDTAEWCESRANKQDQKCNGCPAFDSCKWKIELALQIPDREGEYLLSLPTVSSMRFKDVAAQLARTQKRHFSQAVWKMTVGIEKKDGNVFPVVSFVPCDFETGEPYDLTVKNGGKPTAQAAEQKSKPSIAIRIGGAVWAKWCAGLTARQPYFADKAGNADMYHIIGALGKLGYTEVTEGNLEEIGAQLTDYAKANEEVKKK